MSIYVKMVYDNQPVIGDDFDWNSQLKEVETWEDAYRLGIDLYSRSEGVFDRVIIDAFEKAFIMGLNVQRNRECFLEATKIVAKLYFQYGDYEYATNKLMILLANFEDVPNWTHIYFASAQILIMEILICRAENPNEFFIQLDQIKSPNEMEIAQRNSVYKEFLNRLTAAVNRNDIKSEDIASRKIIEKAIEYRLNYSEELKMFRDTVSPDFPIPELENTQTKETEELRRQIKQHNDEITRLTVSIAEKDAKILTLKNESSQFSDLFTQEVERLKPVLVEKDNLIARLTSELEEKNRLLAQRKEEIDALAQMQQDQIDGHTLLRKNQKILVIGGSEVKERILRGLAKSSSKFDNDDIEFVLEYERIKSFTSRINPWSSKYAGIIVGPCPHNVVNGGDYSSFIQRIKNEPGFPHVEETRIANGELKLTKDSFRQAINRMVVHLQSVN